MKNKKNFLPIISRSLVSSFSLTSTNAYNSTNKVILNESITVTEALNNYQNGHLQSGKSTITKEDIKARINGLNNLSNSRMRGYNRQMTGMSTHTNYRIIRGNYFKKVEISISTSKFVNASFKIKSSESCKTKNFSSETNFKNKVNLTLPSEYIDF